MTNCPYCGGEIPSKDFALRTPGDSHFHFPCSDKALDEWVRLKEILQKINDLTVAYQEEGPFDVQEAFNRVTKIYELSLGKE